ncbi:MAG: hypothetical protein LBP85_09320 [Prevotellaceae bacterium]|jgi:uncharacterized protein YycO|nr:hypothetical protein [Prevotellaceae bacterium]
MKKIIFAISLFVCTTNIFAQFSLKSGDLLFQVGKSTALSDAIAQVTSGADSVNYTHVGIVSIENDEIFVIEATTPKVRKVILDTFLNNSRKINGKPIVAVGRLQSKYFDIIPQAIKNAETCLGKPYDYVYSPDNDEYYCSELVYFAFKNKKGKPVFKAKKMTFCDEQGNMTAAWIRHFEKYKTPIPEGRKGTNPGDMSKSKEITILYRYFD